jgi:succinate dehydrogenase assembly factor 2
VFFVFILALVVEVSLWSGLKLLNESDWDIYYWSTGKRQPPEHWANSEVLEKMRLHASNEGKVIRRMPPLEEILRSGRR